MKLHILDLNKWFYILLSLVYLMKLSTSELKHCRLIECLEVTELESMWKE